MKYSGNKSENIKQLYTDMLSVLDAVGIDTAGLPTDRRREKMAGACLATGQIVSSLKEAKSVMDGRFLKTRDIIDFEKTHFNESISPGSYDDIRRKDLKPLLEAGLVINSADLNHAATNNPHRGYALDAQFAALIKTFGTKKWDEKLAYFLEIRQKIREEMERRRALERIPVTLPSGLTLELSTGEHNLIQKKIIEDFLPTWGMGAEVLYVGDTTDKYLHRNAEALKALNITLEHGELPDIVAFSRQKNLLFLIEAYHSSNPMNQQRVNQLRRLTGKCPAEVVLVTAFLTRTDGMRHLKEVAWETEVWFANEPEHMIHLNGHKFLEIHN